MRLSVSLKRAVFRPPEAYFESYGLLHAWIKSPMDMPVPGTGLGMTCGPGERDGVTPCPLAPALEVLP